MPPDSDEKLLKVVHAAKQQGFDNIGHFMTAFLSADNKRIHKLADAFARDYCLPVTSLMLRRSKWGSSKRRTAKGTKDLSTNLGKQLIELVLPILGSELAVVTATPFARLSPTEVCWNENPQ